MGFFQDYREAYTTIFSWIVNNYILFHQAPSFNPMPKKIVPLSSPQWITFIFVQIAFLLFSLIFTLLSFSTILHALICTYYSQKFTLKRVLIGVQKQWKIFLTNTAWMILLHRIAVLNFFMTVTVGILYIEEVQAFDFNFLVITLASAVGFLHCYGITKFYWEVAWVLLMFDSVRGTQATFIPDKLTKGRRLAVNALVANIQLSKAVIETSLYLMVVQDKSSGTVSKMKCFLLILAATFLGLLLKIIIYIICKSYGCKKMEITYVADHFGGCSDGEGL